MDIFEDLLRPSKQQRNFFFLFLDKLSENLCEKLSIQMSCKIFLMLKLINIGALDIVLSIVIFVCCSISFLEQRTLGWTTENIHRLRKIIDTWTMGTMRR